MWLIEDVVDGKEDDCFLTIGILMDWNIVDSIQSSSIQLLLLLLVLVVVVVVHEQYSYKHSYNMVRKCTV